MQRIIFIAGLVIAILSPFFLYAHTEESGTVIHIERNAFLPSDVTIRQGETIVFENVDTEEHWPASNIHPTHTLYPGTDIEKCSSADAHTMFDSCRGLLPGQTFSFTFLQAGKWRFHDHLYPQLKGTITVLASSAASASETSTETKVSWWRRLLEGIKRTWLSIRIKKNNAEILTDNRALEVYLEKYGVLQSIAQLSHLSADGGSCHLQAHKVGRYGYKLWGSDVFASCDKSVQCNSGCYHGASEALFAEKGIDDIADTVEEVCKSAPSLFYKRQCWHGAGHGLAAWADYDIPEALGACERLPEIARNNCYEGVFMENIVGATSGLTEVESSKGAQGHYTDYLSDDPFFPCSVLEQKYKNTCYLRQSRQMLNLSGNDAVKTSAMCLRLPKTFADLCLRGLSRDLISMHNNNYAPVQNVCAAIPSTSERRVCLTGIADALFWEEALAPTAKTFCEQLTQTADKDACFMHVALRAKDIMLSPGALDTFCKQLPATLEHGCRSGQ